MATSRSEQPRLFTLGSGTPRIDLAGVEWWACDPYPTYFRYEGSKVILRPIEAVSWRTQVLKASDRVKLERVRKVLSDWGMNLNDEDDFAEGFVEEIQESGAWRLARDLRLAMRDDAE